MKTTFIFSFFIFPNPVKKILPRMGPCWLLKLQAIFPHSIMTKHLEKHPVIYAAKPGKYSSVMCFISIGKIAPNLALEQIPHSKFSWFTYSSWSSHQSHGLLPYLKTFSLIESSTCLQLSVTIERWYDIISK